jgi:Domain of unknown function (DUF4279)
MIRPPTYSDDYATCVETYATLRLFSADRHPDMVTARLGIEPTQIITPILRFPKRKNGWFLCSRDDVRSHDTRRHIDWLLDRIEPSAGPLAALRSEGVQCDVCCFFVSIGHGGPCLDPHQMRRLVALDMEIWWDVYSNRDQHWERTVDLSGPADS